MTISRQYADAGSPHANQKKNHLLLSVVEEKALKTASVSITFDFWSMR
jgi:hypothetical protein